MAQNRNPQDEHAFPTPPSIAESRQKLLHEISGSPDVTFIRVPGNIGDHLIQAGTRQLLAGTFYEEVGIRRLREASVRRPGENSIRGLASIRRLLYAWRLGDVRGHTALITGGGGWCQPFHRVLPLVLPLIERRFEKVIVLPSSVDTSVDEVRQALARTKALVFARERHSYNQLRELCRTDIAHDCAFFFDFRPYRRTGKGLLTSYRTDAESAFAGEVPPNNNDISISCETLDEWLWTIARYEVVETDRAHVMIAAAMLGKKVKYRASSYHKLPAIAEYALEGFPIEVISEGDERVGVGV